MTRPAFHTYLDARGDLYVEDGPVICRKTGAVWPVGDGDDAGAPRLTGQLAASATAPEAIPVAESADVVGGSGRCVVVTGHGLFAGVWQQARPGKWRKGEFLLEVVDDDESTISDASGVVAELTGGGEAPAGDYEATEYGEETYNDDEAFTLTAEKERGWPGGFVELDVGIAQGTAVGGKYVTTDGLVWTCEADPDWTITVNEGGSADLAYDSTIIATRAVGPEDDPCGTYQSTPAGEHLHAEFPEAPDEEPALSNPFGTLTMTIAWGGSPDLDIGVSFLGETVGYGHASASDYISWSGDNTEPAGSETVVIDLAQAWLDEAITTVADVVFAADWYPPREGSGPALLTVTYDLPDSPGTPVDYTVHPGSTTPATTPVLAMRVTASGPERVGQPWEASVMAVRRAPLAGVVYVSIEDDGEQVAGVSGPHFAEEIPEPSAGVTHFPLATSDGSGKLKQIHTGPLLWAVGGGGGGPAFVEIANDDFLELDPPDEGTYYDITDFLP